MHSPNARSAHATRTGTQHVPKRKLSVQLESLRRKSLSIFMAFVLAVSMMPSVALADEAGSDTQSDATANVVENEQAPSASNDATALESSSEGAPEVDAPDVESQSASVIEDESAAGEDATAAELDEEEPVPAASEDAILSSNAFVLMQDGDYDEALEYISGQIAPAEDESIKIYANVFQAAEDENGSGDPVRVRDASLTYQWFAADTAVASEADCAALEGKTEAMLEVDAALAAQLPGKYLFVKVSAADGSFLFAPVENDMEIGPVVAIETAPVEDVPDSGFRGEPAERGNAIETAPAEDAPEASAAPGASEDEGKYTLASVSLASTTDGMQLGATITPTAMISSTEAAPEDANPTFTWYKAASSDATEWEPVTGYDAKTGVLELDESLLGSYLKVSVNALDNEVETAPRMVMGVDEYELNRITLMNYDDYFLTGDSLLVYVQAKRLYGSDYGELVQSKVSIQWYLADSPYAEESAWTPIEGATSPRLIIPESAAGKYVMVKATSGASSVTLQDDHDIILSTSLEAAQMQVESMAFTPVSGVDTNANDYIEAELAKSGFSGISVKTISAELPNVEGRDTAVGGIDTGNANNGAIAYFFEDVRVKDDTKSYGTIRKLSVTFELEQNGETVEAEMGSSTRLPWDVGKMNELIATYRDQVEITYADGDSAKSVTQNVTLPSNIAWSDDSKATKVKVKWASSDTAVVKTTGVVKPQSEDKPVTLTATVDPSSIDSYDDGLKSCTYDVPFDITVLGNPEAVAAQKQKLAEALEAGFTKDKVKDFQTNEAVGENALEYDFQLPSLSQLGLSSFGLTNSDYQVVYTSPDDNIVVKTHRGYVYRPLPGSQSGSGTVVCAVTSKDNPEVTASKSLTFEIKPLDQAEIEREAALMDAAVAGYWDGISNGQASDDVTGDLRAFRKATFGADDQVVWSYTYSESNAAGLGIVPADLPDYDPDNRQPWEQFRSSKSEIIQHENLEYGTQPLYNTQVTVDSYLTSEKYGRYAELYPENETLAKLAGTPAAATFTVKGETPEENPYVTATVSVIGVNAKGKAETWASTDAYELERGATATDLTMTMLEATGLKANYSTTQYGFYLESITSPDGARTLGWDEATGRFWQLYVNGEAASVGADSITLQEDDVVIWAYTAWGDPEPQATVNVRCAIYGPNATDESVSWMPATTFTMSDGSTGADLTLAAAEKAGIKLDYSGSTKYNFILKSMDSPFTGETLADAYDYMTESGMTWLVFVNGKPSDYYASGINLKDGDTIVWAYTEYDMYSDPVAPELDIPVTCAVYGPDASGKIVAWAEETEFAVKEGSTADALTVSALEAAGLEAVHSTSQSGFYLESITSPFDGRMLGWDEATGRYWQLFVNGEASDVGASGVELKEGDSIVWAYSGFGDEAPGVSAKVFIVGMDADGNDEAWSSASSFKLHPGATAADLTIALLEDEGLEAVYSMAQYGFYLEFITSPFDGRMLGWDEATGRYWQLFVNGEASDVGASSVELKEGDFILWQYSKYGDAAGFHQVRFESNGGSEVAPEAVARGSKAPKPANPAKDGYDFAGWYSDEALTKSYDFATGVTADMVLYAKWEHADIAYGTVTLSSTSYTCDKTAKKPAVTVVLNGRKLVQGTDYKVAYANNTAVGTATAIVTGTGSYTGTVKRSFAINLGKATVSSVKRVGAGAQVTWTSVKGANGYEVERKVGTGSWAKVGTTTGEGKVTYTDTAKPGKACAYRVRAVANGKKSAYSNSKSITLPKASVAYRTHVQRIGWQGWKKDGAMSGTSGKSLRLEAANIKLASAPYSGGITYRTHVQRVGWQGWKKDGAMSGTSGKSLRLEAVQIKLTGEMAKRYDVYYRVHCQRIGWMGWAKNGQMAGTAGYSYRLEGLEIVLVEKGGKAPGKTADCFRQK